MEIKIRKTPAGLKACISGGPIDIDIDSGSLEALARLRHNAAINGTPINGWWDTFAKGAESVSKLLDSPLARAGISALPYGAAALSVTDVVKQSIAVGKKAVQKNPQVAAVVHNAALGNQSALANMQSLMAGPQANTVKAMAALLADMTRMLQIPTS